MRRGNSSLLRIGLGVVIALFSVVSFFLSGEFNPVTGERQYVSLTAEQEIALGQQSVPQMFEEYGRLLNNQEAQDYVDEVGVRLVNNSIAADTEWVWEFHLIDNPEMINAFALPGGQIFITTALFNEFDTEAQLAGVLGHEIAHVLARHSAQQIARQELTQGLLSAVIVASEDTAAASALIAQLVNMSYSRGAELESDELGVQIMASAGYDPRELIDVMQILASAGGGIQPEFFATHPNPDNRIENIEQEIAEIYPNGVPDNLER